MVRYRKSCKRYPSHGDYAVEWVITHVFGEENKSIKASYFSELRNMQSDSNVLTYELNSLLVGKNLLTVEDIKWKIFTAWKYCLLNKELSYSCLFLHNIPANDNFYYCYAMLLESFMRF